MLKRFLLGMALAVAAIAVVLGGRQLLVAPVAEPPQAGAGCPLAMRDQGLADGAREDGDWQIFVSDPVGEGPRVKVESGTFAVEGRSLPACVLAVTALPTAPYTEVDWRIGRRIALTSGRPRGRVEFAAWLASVPTVEFGAASLYIYDHATVREVSIERLGEVPRRFSVSVAPSPSTDSVEIWLRLTIHAPISTTGKVYLVDPTLTFGD